MYSMLSDFNVSALMRTYNQCLILTDNKFLGCTISCCVNLPFIEGEWVVIIVDASDSCSRLSRGPKCSAYWYPWIFYSRPKEWPSWIKSTP